MFTSYRDQQLSECDCVSRHRPMQEQIMKYRQVLHLKHNGSHMHLFVQPISVNSETTFPDAYFRSARLMSSHVLSTARSFDGLIHCIHKHTNTPTELYKRIFFFNYWRFYLVLCVGIEHEIPTMSLLVAFFGNLQRPNGYEFHWVIEKWSIQLTIYVVWFKVIYLRHDLESEDNEYTLWPLIANKNEIGLLRFCGNCRWVHQEIFQGETLVGVLIGELVIHAFCSVWLSFDRLMKVYASTFLYQSLQ